MLTEYVRANNLQDLRWGKYGMSSAPKSGDNKGGFIASVSVSSVSYMPADCIDLKPRIRDNPEV